MTYPHRLTAALLAWAALASPASAALTDNLIAGWTLNESSAGAGAVTRDSAVGSFPLTDNNTVASAAGRQGTNGVTVVAANSEYLNRTGSLGISNGGSFTGSVWFKVNDPSVQRRMLGQGKSGGGVGFQVYVEAGNVDIDVIDGSVTNSRARILNTMVTGRWYHLVFGWDSATGKTFGYLNNGAKFEGGVNAGPSDLTGELRVGHTTGSVIGTSHFNGEIDELYLWSRVLTDAERVQLWNYGHGLTYASGAFVDALSVAGVQAEVGSTTQAGNQSIDLAGAFQPKALIGWSTYAAANPAAHARMSIGFADGTSQACVSVVSTDAAADSDTTRKYSTDRVWEVLTTAGGVAYSDAVSFDADGFSLTSAGTDANAKLSYLALGGSDLTNAKIVTWSTPAANGSGSVTGFGFQPDLLIDISAYLVAAGSSPNVYTSFGWATPDAQYSVGVSSVDAQATMATRRIVSNALIGQYPNGAARSEQVAVTGFTSDGFTYTVAGSTGGYRHATLGLKFTSPSYVKAGHVTTGTANGQTITASGLGHTPKGVMLMGVAASQVQGFDSVLQSAHPSIGAFDDTRQAVAACEDLDNAATSTAKSWHATNLAYVALVTGSAAQTLGTPSLSSGQFSLTSNGTTARLVPYLSFGQPAGGGQNDGRPKLGIGIGITIGRLHPSDPRPYRFALPPARLTLNDLAS